MPVAIRFAVVPLMVCSVEGYVFVNDMFSVLFVGLMGFSNGYLGSLCILLVNDVCELEERGNTPGCHNVTQTWLSQLNPTFPQAPRALLRDWC